jgi:serine/threonine protein kinase
MLLLLLQELTSGHGDMTDDLQWDDMMLRRLSEEVDVLSHISHPNVVLFMGVVLQPPCVVTEYCPLGSLFDVLRRARQGDQLIVEKLNWLRRVMMAIDAAKGMLALHSHPKVIVHRDLKSPNLFVTGNLTVKVSVGLSGKGEAAGL